MSLSGSLSSALSGLTAASRAVEIVSANVANAMTEGYAKRDLVLASQTVGGNGAGVKVVAVSRTVDERLLADQREAAANLAGSSAKAEAWRRIETAIGYPTEEGSLSARIDALEAALITAASRPEETVRLDRAVAAAVSVVDGIQTIASEIQDLRMEADADISRMVEELNGKLQQVETLNRQIFKMESTGQQTAALMDQRQQIVDRIAEIVPVRQVARNGNQIALYTSAGAALIDGPAARLDFQATGMIVPEMTAENGLLSGLKLNSQTLSLTSSSGSNDGGLLSAAFFVRDALTTEAQVNVDAMARDLIERFQDSSLDPTIATGAAGLFTDGGNAFDVVNEKGVSQRIAVNALVIPSAGGASWHLRDGLGATTPGASGNSELLTALAEQLSTSRSASTGVSSGLPRSFSALASDLLSAVDAQLSGQESTEAFHSGRVQTLKDEIATNGVNTDEEMQKLLLIEQVYAANARVIQTVDMLMQQLLEI